MNATMNNKWYNYVHTFVNAAFNAGAVFSMKYEWNATPADFTSLAKIPSSFS